MRAWRAVRVGSVVSTTLAFAVLLPGLARACPMCASQQPGGSTRIVALGLMLVLPFAIAYVVFAALSRSAWVRESSGRAVTAAGGERARALREPSP